MQLDHLVYGVPDLPKGIEQLEDLLGVNATMGGRHPGKGTYNALIALRNESYIEIIAPDPGQRPFGKSMWFELQNLSAPKLLTYAIKSSAIQAHVQAAHAAGIPIGAVEAGSRAKPDGTMLQWQLTNPSQLLEGGLIPFLIDWGESVHPTVGTDAVCTMVELQAWHPAPQRVANRLLTFDVDIPIRVGAETKLSAIIDCPRGRLELA